MAVGVEAVSAVGGEDAAVTKKHIYCKVDFVCLSGQLVVLCYHTLQYRHVWKYSRLVEQEVDVNIVE